MTRIAVFCDGTWNSPTIPEPTSVYKLYRSANHTISDVNIAPGDRQAAVYFAGIGTDDRFDTNTQKFLHRYGGGAFGWGLDAKVKQAYEFLCRAYQPGDEIYLFGFSRGAYTARSVAGMIRKCGLVEDHSTDGINRAFELYRKPGARNRPDELHIREERRRLSPRFATSEKDLKWRDDGSHLVNIAYLGVFDTVGARGIPRSFFGPIATLWNARYSFHDGDLSSLVKSARHAMAIDERRPIYRPSAWQNVDRLNGSDTAETRPYQQTWFIGNHSTLGGSSDTQKLSAIPMTWIWDGAKQQLLTHKADADPADRPVDPLAPSDDIDHTFGLMKRWRKGPKRATEIHASVETRLSQKQEYRPKPIRAFFTSLFT